MFLLFEQDLSSSPTSSPKTKVAAVSSLQKPSQMGPTQLLKRHVPRPDTVLAHKQAQGNALQLPQPLPSQQLESFSVVMCVGSCLLSPVFNPKLPVAAFPAAWSLSSDGGLEIVFWQKGFHFWLTKSAHSHTLNCSSVSPLSGVSALKAYWEGE